MKTKTKEETPEQTASIASIPYGEPEGKDEEHLEVKEPRAMTGAQLLVEALRREGVKHIFGIPGGANLPIYDALFDATDMTHILVKHEQCAAHMAEGYARATGKVGVCMATSGPGATNLVTGIADAHMDSVPIVAITGQVPTTAIGKDAFQEADVFGITMPITKHNYLVKNANDLPRVMKEAFYIASTGRPGPVVVDMPKDVSNQVVEKPVFPKKIHLRGYTPEYEGPPEGVSEAAQVIAEAKRPIVYVGGGATSGGAFEELKAFIDKTGIPVTTTLLGLGAFPGTHSLFMGMPGMHGTVTANYAMDQADLLIAIGTRFDDRVTGKLSAFATQAKVIHFDIDPSEIGKNKSATVGIVGNLREALRALTKRVSRCDIDPWRKQVDEWKKEHPFRYRMDGDKVLKPQYVIQQIYEMTKDYDTIVTNDVGQCQMWSAQYYLFNKPRRSLSSGGLGTMGFALPSAIGAQIGCPESLVVAVAGDGSLQMVIQDLATASLNKLPIKICLLNNRFLGMVRQWQQLFYNHRYLAVCQHQNMNCPPQCTAQYGTRPECPEETPNWMKLADAYGCEGITVRTPAEAQPALKRALEITDRPTLINFLVHQEENVYPMIPAGGSVADLIMDGE